MSNCKSVFLRCAAIGVLLSVSAAGQTPADPPEFRTGVFRGQVVEYQVVGGWAVFEGDILLGTAEEIEAETSRALRALEKGDGSFSKQAAIRDGDRFRWPGGVIPYTIDADLPDPQRVLDAIAHWNANTPVRLIPRTAEQNHVRFLRQNSGGVCFSAIGMIGGQQTIRLDDRCRTGTIIHEIGHTVGFWHEQSRPGRDQFVQVNAENVEPQFLGQFSIRNEVRQPAGPYDYGSVMHYGAFAFSENGQKTISTLPDGIPIGQRQGLSALDVQGVQRLYGLAPTEVTVTTFPSGLEIEVDGQIYRAPQTLVWAPGSRHTLSAPAEQQPDERGVWAFARWSDNGERTHEMVHDPAEGVYVANFMQRSRIEISVDPPGSGEVEILDPSEDGTYAPGTRVRVRAVPGEGFFFLEWQGQLSREPQGRGAAEVVITTGSTRPVVARFTSAAPVTVTSNPAGIPVQIEGADVVTPHNFLWDVGSRRRLEAPAFVENGLPGGAADVRYRFEAWQHGGPRVQEIVVSAPGERFTARYRPQYLVTTMVQPRGAGRVFVTPSSLDGFYDEGQTLELRAEASTGFGFSHWEGGLTGPENPGLYTVSEQNRVTANFAERGRIEPGGVVSGASFLPGPLAPGLIFTVFGFDIGPQPPAGLVLDAQGRVSTVTGGTRVLVGGIPAPVIFASRNQVTAVAPYEIEGFFVTSVQVEHQGEATEAVLVPVMRAAPGVFALNASGFGQAAALNQEGTLNSAANPAARGEIVVLYATGEGATDPPGIDGELAGLPPPKPKLPVRVFVGGVEAEALYAGAAPGLVAGVLQVNARIAPGTPVGPAVEVLLDIDGLRSQTGVTLAVE